MTFSVPEKFRIRAGRYGSDASYGNNGAFEVRLCHRCNVMIGGWDDKEWLEAAMRYMGVKP